MSNGLVIILQLATAVLVALTGITVAYNKLHDVIKKEHEEVRRENMQSTNIMLANIENVGHTLNERLDKLEELQLNHDSSDK